MSKQITEVLLEVNPEFSPLGTILIYNKGTGGFGTIIKDLKIFLVDEVSKNKITLNIDDTIIDNNGIKFIHIEYKDLDYFYTEQSKLYVTGEFTSNTKDKPTVYTHRYFKSNYFPPPVNSTVSFKVDSFLKEHKKLPIGNLLYKRIRMGFPTWSGVETNDWSGALKLLEPLFSPMYSYFNKNIELNNSQRLGTPLQETIEIQGSRDDVGFIVLNKSGNSYTLFEGDSSIHPKYCLLNTDQKDVQLSSILLDRTSSIESFIDISPFLNTILYCKSTVMREYGYVTIKGYSSTNEPIQERIRVVSNNFIQGTKRFAQITEISSTLSVQFANFVDCRSSHYVAKNTTTYPPIVNSNLEFFDPIFKLSYNTENTLDVYTETANISTPVEQFTLESDSNVTSVYLDEHLRCYWSDSTSIKSSILSKDLTKNTGMHPSTNVNNVISVSNTNTVVGDTVSVVVNSGEWDESLGMILQIKNGDNILYYNHTTREFTRNMSIYYLKKDDSFLEFDIEIENELPYIFTVRDPLFKSTNVAVTIAEKIISILDTDVNNSTIIIHDGVMKLSNIVNIEDTLLTGDKFISNNVKLDISTFDVGTIKDWSVTWNGRYINNIDNTFESISRIHNTDTGVVLLIDRTKILKDNGDFPVVLVINVESTSTPYTHIMSESLLISTNNTYTITIDSDTIGIE